MRAHDRLAHEDPSRPVLTNAPAGTWWSAQREMTKVDWQSELSGRFVDSGFRDLALVRVYNPFRDDLILGLYRSDRRFEKRAFDMLELLYPHVAGALATRRGLALIEGKKKGKEQPAVFVGFPGATVEIDAAARRLLTRYLGPVTGGGWLRVEHALARAASKFAFAQSGGRSQMLWPGLRVDFAVIPPRAAESLRLCGFLVEETEDDQAANPAALVTAVLSPRQLAVASYFAGGMDIPTIAELLRIGEETARSHLRAAYVRLRVSGRAELARVLRSEP